MSGREFEKERISVWDHSSHEKFYNYYSEASQTEATLQRFRSIRDCVLRVVASSQAAERILEVADIGCGAGSQCIIWAELAHHVHGLDVNESLLDLARERAAMGGYNIDFRLGSSMELPWDDETMDICLVVELLEHVGEWQTCLNEFARILKPGGVLFLTTTNKLCPIQQEFTLPLYSWYPAPIKRYCEHLAVTTHPKLVNFARYPAVNWFSFYGLCDLLTPYGFYCLDRFDVIDVSKRSILAKFVVSSVRTIPFLRWLAHIATPSTLVVAVKENIVRDYR